MATTGRMPAPPARGVKGMCWCGASDSEAFSAEYRRCVACGTLFLAQMPSADRLRVTADDGGLYGKEYWLSHQEDSYAQPNIFERSRQDLPERCLYWLTALLKYKLPPAGTLEVGCAHGGFVALMQWAGFQATGLELSPWVVDFAQRTFGVEMLQGRLEDQALTPASFDVIALMDVLEHLPDPVATVRRCVGLLRPGGLLLVQTPCCPSRTKNAEQLLAEGDPFVKAQLKEEEHLYLFTQESVRTLLQRAGCPHVTFEPAIFEYDMFFVAGAEPITPIDPAAVDAWLERSPLTRLLRALVDLGRRTRAVEDDRRLRIEMIDRLNRHIYDTHADYETRGRVLDEHAAALARIRGNRIVRALVRLRLLEP